MKYLSLLPVFALLFSCTKQQDVIKSDTPSKSFPVWDTSGTILYVIADDRQDRTEWVTFKFANNRIVGRVDSSTDGFSKKQDRAFTGAYDSVGRLIQWELTTYTYDISGRMVSSESPGFNQVRYKYNSLGQIISDTGFYFDGMKAIRDFEYDGRGNITKQVRKIYLPADSLILEYTDTFTYDDKKNPWSNVAVPAFFQTHFLQSPYITPNNVLSKTHTENGLTSTQRFDYTYNSYGLASRRGSVVFGYR